MDGYKAIVSRGMQVTDLTETNKHGQYSGIVLQSSALSEEFVYADSGTPLHCVV